MEGVKCRLCGQPIAFTPKHVVACACGGTTVGPAKGIVYECHPAHGFQLEPNAIWEDLTLETADDSDAGRPSGDMEPGSEAGSATALAPAG